MVPGVSRPSTPIILLEDDKFLRALLADGLQHAGLPAIEAATKDAARRALATVAGRAVLMADRSLDADGPNGFQFAADALTAFPDLRVIYVSGTHLAIRRRVLGQRERALLKPFAMVQFLSTVRDLVG